MDFFDIFFTGFEYIINAIFILLPAVMRFMAFSILMATIGKILKNKKGVKWTLIKFAHFAFYGLYMAWRFSFMSIYSLPEQIVTIVFMLFIFIALIVVYMKKSFAFFGKQVINYYTIWLFFFIALGFILFFDFRAGAIGFSVFYFALSIVLIRITKNEVKSL